jgi:GT2 family glycosyltransferase
MKFSIVMAYFNRKRQLETTLNIFEKLYANKYDFEVIIVDDASNKENELDEFIKKYNFDIKLLKISSQEKGKRINSSVVYNKGFKKATGDIVIIQNPECCHVGDLLNYLKLNLKDDLYFAFSCFSTNTYEYTKELLSSDDIFKKTNDKNFLEKNGNACYLNKLNWFNHPISRPTGYHFCSAIYKKNLEKIGGFDERFKDGYCFDDNEFLLSIKYILRLKIINVEPKNGFVIHQHHSRTQYNIKNINELYLRNQRLFFLKKMYLERFMGMH